MRVNRFVEALVDLDRIAARELLSAAFEESGLDAVIRELVVPSLERIGDDWVQGKTSLSAVYMSSRICEELMNPLIPRESGAIRRGQPKIAIAALLDYHLLGKKIVQLVLRSSGYEVLDYGQGARVEDLVRRVAADRIEVLLISTLMLPAALKVKELRRALDGAALHPKIVVGGAPFRFDDQLWKEVGADAMGVSASDAVRVLDGIVEERTRATYRQHELT